MGHKHRLNSCTHAPILRSSSTRLHTTTIEGDIDRYIPRNTKPLPLRLGPNDMNLEGTAFVEGEHTTP
jgi:hypothetical protein